MKKIGILTFHDTTNFGAALQTVATYKAVKELCGGGIECEIINYHCKNIDDRELPIKKYNFQGKTIKSFLYFILTNKRHIHKHNKLMTFVETEAVVSNEHYTRTTISKATDKYEKFVVGGSLTVE